MKPADVVIDEPPVSGDPAVEFVRAVNSFSGRQATGKTASEWDHLMLSGASILLSNPALLAEVAKIDAEIQEKTWSAQASRLRALLADRRIHGRKETVPLSLYCDMLRRGEVGSSAVANALELDLIEDARWRLAQGRPAGFVERLQRIAEEAGRG
jgi:hypothetical protein